MKSITSLQEAQQAINELQNRVDTLSAKNWDRRQTRIVNAHPSVDPYDYVVRKELDDRIGGSVTEVTATGEVTYKGTFGLNDASAGMDKTPHLHIIKGGVPFEVRFNAKVAATGSDLLLYAEIRTSAVEPGTWISILPFNTWLHLPMHNTWINYHTTFRQGLLIPDDCLMRIAVWQEDSNSVCREVELVVRWR